MAKEFDETNRFSIWGNKEKKTDKHPDFSGTLNVDGVEYFIDAWKRRPDQSEKAPALSGKVKRKDKQGAAKPADPAKAGFVDDDLDDVPF